MGTKVSKPSVPIDGELREAARTVTASTARDEQLTSRLEYVAELLSDASRLPTEPMLAWRDDNRVVRHQAIGSELVVGRQPGSNGLVVADKLLSKRHFRATMVGKTCELEDLASHNGTAVNRPGKRVQRKALRSGDLILAGAHTFVFLDALPAT